MLKKILMTMLLCGMMTSVSAVEPVTDATLQDAMVYGIAATKKPVPSMEKLLQPWAFAERKKENPYRHRERVVVYTPYLLTALQSREEFQQKQAFSLGDIRTFLKDYDGIVVLGIRVNTPMILKGEDFTIRMIQRDSEIMPYHVQYLRGTYLDPEEDREALEAEETAPAEKPEDAAAAKAKALAESVAQAGARARQNGEAAVAATAPAGNSGAEAQAPARNAAPAQTQAAPAVQQESGQPVYVGNRPASVVQREMHPELPGAMRGILPTAVEKKAQAAAKAAADTAKKEAAGTAKTAAAEVKAAAPTTVDIHVDADGVARVKTVTNTERPAAKTAEPVKTETPAKTGETAKKEAEKVPAEQIAVVEMQVYFDADAFDPKKPYLIFVRDKYCGERMFRIEPATIK